MKNLIALKLTHSVKVGIHGGEEATFFQSKDYALTLSPSGIIDIENKKTKKKVSSTLFNTIYFIEEEAHPIEEKAPSADEPRASTPARRSHKG